MAICVEVVISTSPMAVSAGVTWNGFRVTDFGSTNGSRDPLVKSRMRRLIPSAWSCPRSCSVWIRAVGCAPSRNHVRRYCNAANCTVIGSAARCTSDMPNGWFLAGTPVIHHMSAGEIGVLSTLNDQAPVLRSG